GSWLRLNPSRSGSTLRGSCLSRLCNINSTSSRIVEGKCGMTQSASRQFVLMEGVLRHQRLFLALVLIVVVSLSWFWIVSMAQDMYGSMLGPAAWMMTPDWT